MNPSNPIHTPNLFVVVILLVLLALSTSAADIVPVKHLQGPPQDFSRHELPDPLQASMSSHSAMFPVVFERDTEQTDVWAFHSDLPVDSTHLLRLSLIAKEMKFLKQIKMTFKNPSGQVVAAEEPVEGFFGWTDHKSGAALTWQIDMAMLTQGTWKLRIESALPDTHADTGRPSVMAVLENGSPYMALTQLASYKNLRVGQDIGLLVQLMNEDEHNARLLNLGLATKEGDQLTFQAASKKIRPFVPTTQSFKSYLGLSASDAFRMEASVSLQRPDGSELVSAMHDDGMHMDKASNDGILGASFKADQPGVYVATIDMKAITDNGVTFHRSQHHVFRVVDIDLKLNTKTASLALQENEESAEMLKINLHLDSSDKSLVGRKFRAYAEVWATGSDKSSDAVPVAWIGGMSNVERLSTSEQGEHLVLPLEMSMKWISRAEAKLPLVLRNVYLQDADSSVPLCEAEEIQIQIHRLHERNTEVPASVMQQMVQQKISTKFSFNAQRDSLSEVMYFGLRPRENSFEVVREKRKQAQSSGTPNAGHRLVLVHGYCSSDTPFDTEDFTSYSIFLDLESNRSNDEFALLLREFGTQFTSFSTAVHSQGGAVALHLYTFYWSAMDNSEHLVNGKLVTSEESRLIQSVGSPYHGSSLAGGLAAIGDLIGFGCGKNTDLTHDGAELWLATIPQASRNQVYYYTSQYKKWSWCIMLAQAVLKWPNDGTTEKKYSGLDGGHFVHHAEGQCHSDNMKYEPQCREEPRSKEINAKASRS